MGRKDWAPGAGPDEGVERIFTDRPVSTQVIARDRMQGALYKVAKRKYGSQISFDWETEVDVEDDEVTLTRGSTEEVLRPDLVVGAGGTARRPWLWRSRKMIGGCASRDMRTTTAGSSRPCRWTCRLIGAAT